MVEASVEQLGGAWVVDRLVEMLESQVADVGLHNVCLAELFDQWRLAHAFGDEASEYLIAGGVELLRVWMEYQHTAGVPVTVADSLKMLPEIKIDQDGLSLLEFECERLFERSKELIDFPKIATRWGDFQLLGILGEGAVAKVFLAQQISMSHRLVALKITSRETSEPQVLSIVQHSGIVPIHSVHKVDGLSGICMPFLGSTTIADLLDHVYPERADSFGQAAIENRNPLDEAIRAAGKHTFRGKASGKTISLFLTQRQEVLKNLLSKVSCETEPIQSVAPADRLGGQTSESEWSGPPQTFSEAPGLRGDQSNAKFSEGDCQVKERPGIHAESAEEIEPGVGSTSDSRNVPLIAEFNLDWDEESFLDAVLGIGIQLAEALQFVHQFGITHNDIKPANILIGRDGKVRLLDFNISQVNASNMRIAEFADRLVGGTVAYMSPEFQQKFTEGVLSFEVDGRADVYSLGVVLCELLTGYRPPSRLQGNGKTNLCSQLAKRMELPAGVCAILNKALEKDPERRYQSASEVAEDLRAQLTNRHLVHQAQPSRVEIVNKWRKRHSIVSSGISVAILTLVLGSIIGKWSWDKGVRREALVKNRAVNELSQVLPEAISLLSVIGEFGELTTETKRKMSDVFLHLHTLAVTSDNALGRELIEAPIVDQLAVLHDLWIRQIASTGSSDSPFRFTQDGLPEPFMSPERLQRIISELSDGQERQQSEFLSYYFAGNYREALANAEGSIESLSLADYSVWLLIGHSHLKLEQFAMASNAYSQALSRERAFPAARFYRGICFLKLDLPSAAVSDFRIVTKQQPSFYQAQHNLALAHQALSQWREAEGILTKMLEAKGASISTHLARAKVRTKMSDLKGAAEDYRHAISVAPVSIQDWLGLSRLWKQKDPQRAIELMTEAVKRFPTSIDARQQLAHLLSEYDQNDWAAIEQLDYIIEQDPLNARGLAGRAVLNARHGQTDMALKDLGDLIEINPDDPMLIYQIACCYSLLAEHEMLLDESSGPYLEGIGASEEGILVPAGKSERLNRIIYLENSLDWYRKSVWSNVSIAELAKEDPDLKALRLSSEFESINRILLR